MLGKIGGVLNSNMNDKIKNIYVLKILEEFGHEGVYGPIRINDCDYWFLGTDVHRDDDLPAVVRTDGKKIWCRNNEIHRDGDKPAITYPSGAQFWYKHGKLHRPNHPFGAHSNHSEGAHSNRSEGGKANHEGTKSNPEGGNGGPAAIYFDGRLEYYFEGELHRIGGPAVVHITKQIYIVEYYEHGKRHRYDGPALIHESTEKHFINGYETVLI